MVAAGRLRSARRADRASTEPGSSSATCADCPPCGGLPHPSAPYENSSQSVALGKSASRPRAGGESQHRGEDDRTQVRGPPAHALGQSNRQIADELFISPRTLTVHVSHLGNVGTATRSPSPTCRSRPGPWRRVRVRRGVTSRTSRSLRARRRPGIVVGRGRYAPSSAGARTCDPRLGGGEPFPATPAR